MSTILSKIYEEREQMIAQRREVERKLEAMIDDDDIRQLRKARQRYLNYYTFKYGRHPNSYEIAILDSIFFNESLIYVKNLVNYVTESLCVTQK
jgi:hypothetical protein